MYISEFDKDPNLHSVQINTGREAVRVARALGLFRPTGGLKLLAGMLWQGPEFRGIAIDTAGLQDIHERSRRPIPEIPAYLARLSMPEPQLVVEAAQTVDAQFPPQVESAPAA